MSVSHALNDAWINYIDKYQKEPSDTQHFFQEALNYSYNNDCNVDVSFLDAQAVFNQNKGKLGNIKQSHISYMPSEEELDDILDEIDHLNEVPEYKFDWEDIKQRVQTNDVEFIKNLIVSQQFDVNRQDNDHQKTILMYCAEYGSLLIAELLCHYGANIDLKCRFDIDALGYARRNGNYHISELLIFYKLGGSVGTQIKSIINHMQRQNGFIKYCLKNMTKQQLDNIVHFVIKNIKDMTPFSDDLLNLSFAYTNNIQSELFKTLMNTYELIIKDTKNKIGWSYLKNYFMKSTLWLRPYPSENETKENESETAKDPNGHILTKYMVTDNDIYDICNDCGYNLEMDSPFYLCRECGFYSCHICHPKRLKKMKSDIDYSKTLYNELYIRIVKETEIQAQQDLQFLKDIAKKNENLWNNMVTFNCIKTITLARQDCIINGMNAKYSKKILIADKSSIGFNPISHYDVNIYLNEMILKANQIDKEFQNDMENIINCINENENMINLGILGYKCGPVKQQQRAKTKVEVDYAKEKYPTASMLLDLNRCTINCKSIESMLLGLKLFVKIINLKKTSIIGIARCKNGWTEFDFNNPGYTDIKLNIIISSKRHGSLIGEVQFLLNLMADYKLKAHSLYSVERHQEFVENMKSIMPISLSLEQQLFTLANYGDYKGLIHYVITNDLINNTNELLKRNFKNQSILTSMCRFDCVRAFKTIQKLCNKKEFYDALHECDDIGHAPIGYAIEANSIEILEILINLYPKSVLNYFKQDFQNTDSRDNPGNQGVLYYSCRNNNIKLTKWVIQNTVYNDKSFTCLMEYCKYKHLHVIKTLLSKQILGDNENYNQNVYKELDKKDSNGWCALHYASNKGWHIIKLIFDLIPNNNLKFKYLNEINNDGDTVFKLICLQSQLKVELLKYITNGLNTSQMYELLKLSKCINSVSEIKVFEYLCDIISIHNKNNKNEFNLMEILNKRFIKACNMYTSDIETEYMINIYKKYDINVSNTILNERDINNKTVLMYTCGRSGKHQIKTLNLLFENIETDNKNLLKYIYICDKNGMNALHYAFKTGFIEVGKRLFDKIKELNDNNESKEEDYSSINNIIFAADNNGWNVFHFACWNNVKHMKFICQQLSTENEEKIQTIITKTNKPHNITPLMICCKRGKIVNVKYLLDKFGHNFKSKLQYIDMKNGNGQNAIDIVNAKNNKKLLQILKDSRQECLSNIKL